MHQNSKGRLSYRITKQKRIPYDKREVGRFYNYQIWYPPKLGNAKVMKKNDLCKFLAGKVCLCATTMLTTIPVYGNNEADSLGNRAMGFCKTII